MNTTQKIKNQSGLSVRSQLRVGAVKRAFKNFSEFSSAFVDNVLVACPTNKLTGALNLTNETCKKVNKNWPQCEQWAGSFNVPFARG
jgi:hypothetical protein